MSISYPRVTPKGFIWLGLRHPLPRLPATWRLRPSASNLASLGICHSLPTLLGQLIGSAAAFFNARRDAFRFIQLAGLGPERTGLFALAGFGLQRGVGTDGVGEIHRTRRWVTAVIVQRFDETLLCFGPVLLLRMDVA